MEIQVNELIEKIKREGIDSASQQASVIKTEAGKEAARIIEAAKKEAEEIVSKGRQDADRFEKAGIAALEQASRNLVLSFKDEIQGLLDRIIASHTAAGYDENVLKNTLPQLLQNWVSKGSAELSVILPESELGKLQAFFSEKLTGELWKGVELKSSRKLSQGFHISNKEGSVYYDFSAEAVSGMLSAYLNPKLSEILNKSTKV